MVTKDNDLVGASYSLGVAEQRLIFLAIIKAREQHKLIDAMGLLRNRLKELSKAIQRKQTDSIRGTENGSNWLV